MARPSFSLKMMSLPCSESSSAGRDGCTASGLRGGRPPKSPYPTGGAHVHSPAGSLDGWLFCQASEELLSQKSRHLLRLTATK
jgi:hypothetical protein